MIVVACAPEGQPGAALGEAVAGAAAAAGAAVEIVTTVPDGPAGDELILALGQSAIGHAAVLRRSGGRLEAPDVALALRYLPDVRVIVPVGLEADVAAAAFDGAAWAGATVVAVLGAGAELPPGLPDSAVVFEAPAAGRSSTGFATLVGRFAAALDAGTEAGAAFGLAVPTVAAERVG